MMPFLVIALAIAAIPITVLIVGACIVAVRSQTLDEGRRELPCRHLVRWFTESVNNDPTSTDRCSNVCRHAAAATEIGEDLRR